MDFGAIAGILAALGAGGIITNALRSRASKSKEVTEAIKGWTEQYSELRQLFDAEVAHSRKQDGAIAALQREVSALRTAFGYYRQAVRIIVPQQAHEIAEVAERLRREQEGE